MQPPRLALATFRHVQDCHTNPNTAIIHNTAVQAGQSCLSIDSPVDEFGKAGWPKLQPHCQQVPGRFFGRILEPTADEGVVSYHKQRGALSAGPFRGSQSEGRRHHRTFVRGQCLVTPGRRLPVPAAHCNVGKALLVYNKHCSSGHFWRRPAIRTSATKYSAIPYPSNTLANGMHTTAKHPRSKYISTNYSTPPTRQPHRTSRPAIILLTECSALPRRNIFGLLRSCSAIFIFNCGLINTRLFRSHTSHLICLVIVVPHEYEPLALSSFSYRPFPLSRPWL